MLGTKDVDRLSDKQLHFVHRLGVHTKQACLYSTSSDSLLYQEMLSFKASQAFSVGAEQELDEDDDSDWEILQDEGECYDGGSETSPSSTAEYSDYDDDDGSGPYPHNSPYVFATTSKGILHYDSADSDEEEQRGGGARDACLDGRIRIQGDMDLQHSDDEIEVGFHSRRGGNIHPPGNGTRSSGHGGKPNLSSEGPGGAMRPVGAILRRGQRTIVVHPTVHPQERVAMTTTGNSRGIRHHAHPRRRSKKKKPPPPKVEMSIVPATKITPPTVHSQRSNGGDINNANNYPSSLATTTKTSASCPKDLMLAPRSISVSPRSGILGGGYPAATARRTIIDDGIDVIPPSTSEDEGGASSSRDSSPRHHRRHPLPPSKRYSFDEPAPLLHVPPLSGSSSSLEMNAQQHSAASSPSAAGKKSPSDQSSIRNKFGREEDTDSPFANRPLGLTTTAGLIQTSRLVPKYIMLYSACI